MSDALENPPSFGGNAGEAVPEVDPDDLKAFWQEGDLHARHPGYAVALATYEGRLQAANLPAVWYRSSMIWLLNKYAQEQLAPWVKDEQVSDAVFRTMATIPMEWIGQTPRQGFPFDLETFFRRLREGGVQNG